MKSAAIAIVGMAGRFPGARNIAEFWHNLRDGVEAIRPFSDAELLAAGVSANELAQPEYVKSGVVLEDLDMFDAAFFGFSPRDAAIMDPQHRIFLECAWEALEDAGHVAESFAGSIGVYAGSGMNSYMIHNLLTNQVLVESAGLFLIRQTGNDKDVLATRVSYELNLHGPSMSVQTACSTSLVAVHLACQSLLNQECDMALAGGVTIEFPHGRGYLYRDGEILSRDGHCRAFDADSSGTVFSSGAGLVVLRRLDEALADRDTIHAVILGSAVNNDGSRKVGYLAPSVDGQAEVVEEALGVAGVKASEISYVETHGTGTKVGDPIEIKALTQAFRQTSQGTGTNYCAIGSLKSNIGHLDTAAGVAGLIKTTLALKHRQIPANLHFRKPNPLIDFAHSPFYVNTGLTEWKTPGRPRRAGVTSLGIGGTNAHVVLEEAPQLEERVSAQKPYELLVLSAKTASALEQASQNLSFHLRDNPSLRLQDAAYTLQAGRKPFAHRRAFAAATTEEALRLLSNPEASRVFTGQAPAATSGVVFMFSGQGSQYVNMGRELYETEAIFRAQIDICAERLTPDLGLDLRTLLYPPEQESAAADRRLSQTRFTQPALFSIEYALAQWWMTHGVTPAAMIGHSIGEYVAACLAGVFSFEDGLHLSAVRGRLMDEMPNGSMLAVSTAAAKLSIPEELAIAAINGPEQCVLSGPTDAIQKYAGDLEKQQIVCRLLHTSHAFHSAMMDPMLEAFHDHLAKVTLRAPRIPYLSNVTGAWITPVQATDPFYWTRHLRNTVRFSDCLAELFLDPARVFLEVGPGQALMSLTRQHAARLKGSKVLSSMRHPQEQVSDAMFLLNTVGQLWITGQSIDWTVLHSGEEARRIPLPTYPFERQCYWIEPGGKLLAGKGIAAARRADVATTEPWFHQRVWKKLPAAKTSPLDQACWLVFFDETGLGAEVSKQLKAAGHEVLQVSAGTEYKRAGSGSYVIRPGEREDYDLLLADIARHENVPAKILHLWSVLGFGSTARQSLDQTLDLSFYSLLFLAQALGDQDLGAVDILCVSNGLHSVTGEVVDEPARATLLGPVRVIPREFPGTRCRHIDLDREIEDLERAASAIILECSLRDEVSCVAYRKTQRWVESFESTSLRIQPSTTRLKEKGVYLITGGLGGIGLLVAEHLARTVHARLVLVGRTPLPPASEWKALNEMPDGTSVTRQKIRKVRELESAGAEVLAIAADVTDRTQMEQAVRMVRQRFGGIDGVIHAAGLIEDGPLQIKNRDSAARVLAPKIQGTLALQEALGDCKLDFWLLFSSISSLVPPAGQVDYAAANAFLDAFALSQSGQPVTAVNWGMWAGVGMAGRNTAGSHPGRHPISHPILGRRLVQSETETVDSVQLSCEKNWLLNEHRFKNGSALVAGTAYLQLAAAALIGDHFEPSLEFEDVFFLAPLAIASEETKEVRIRLRRQHSGFRFSILAKDILAKDQEWIEYASGQIARGQKRIPADRNVAEICARCGVRRIDFDDRHRTRQERYFDFGSRWRNLQTLYVGEGEAVAELQLGQDFLADLPAWFLHPALFDLATGSALYLIPGYEESEVLYLPLSYKRIRFYRPMPARVYSHIRSREENSAQREIATFDFTLLDAEGRVVAQIEEFCLRRMAAATDGSAPRLRPQAARTHSEPADLIASREISSVDGIRAFDQILCSNMPPGIVVIRGEFAAKPTGLPATASPPRSTPKPEGEASAEAKTWSAMVPIQPNGSRIPLFCIHALGTSLLFYRQLAAYLGPDQPFYALQSPLASQAQTREPSIEELASIYIDELQTFLPGGPYLLGGASLGGIIALEMSQQLYARDKKPGLLILFDAIVPGSHHRVAVRDQISRHWQNFRNQGAVYLLQRAVSKSEYGWSRLLRSARAVGCSCYRLAGRSLPAGLSYFQVEEAHKRALERYTVQSYPGKITLMRAADVPETVGARRDSTLGWQTFAGGGLEIHDVPGDHISMFEEPNVRTLAETLKAILPSRQAGGELAANPAAVPVSDSPVRSTVQLESGVENVLAEWWRELLGVETVSFDDDFFDLGGHSLIAIRLFSKIKKTYRQDFGLSTLFEARTIRQMAGLIRKAATSNVPGAAPSSAVVAIRRQGSRLPLFVVSGVGGHAIAFNGVTRYLGEDQPVYALQAQGLDGREPFLTRVEDMAASYLRGIRAVQPHGPYCLAGYSFGGFVVFEMAQQLHAAGETVSLLGLLDTIEWQYLERHNKSADLRRRLAMYKLRFQRVFLSGNGLRHPTIGAVSVLTRKLYHLMYKLRLLSAPSIPDLRTVNRIAASLYRPTVYPGSLTIFRSVSRSLLDGDDELLGWGGLAAGGIDVQDVTGNHLDMLSEPNVRMLAEKLRACLDRVQKDRVHEAHRNQISEAAVAILEPTRISG